MLSHILHTYLYTLFHPPFRTGQLFDAHGPSFHSKTDHTSKGHMTNTNTTGLSPTRTKKGIDQEAARKKQLLLWREIKDKELQEELKTQQLLLQKEKTERVRFLQEQQRKREQIKKWRDAEAQLKIERDIAEQQARQVVIALMYPPNTTSPRSYTLAHTSSQLTLSTHPVDLFARSDDRSWMWLNHEPHLLH